jgi:hypothetical protein
MLKVKGINTTSPKISINPNFSAITAIIIKTKEFSIRKK